MSQINNLNNNINCKEKDINCSNKSIKVPKGTRDYGPLQISLRNKLFNCIIETFQNHGAEEIDTPVFELKETLTNKYGEDSKLIYDLADQGGENLALRYDLTVPLARYISCNKIDFIKRYHIGKVYRRDNPAMTRGRYREFYQCDFDICGNVDPLIADVECCVIVCQILSKLQIGTFKAKISHRQILDGYMKQSGVPDSLFRTISSSIDKLDKTPLEDVRKEIIHEKGLSPTIADQLLSYTSIKGGIETIQQLSSQSLNSTFIQGLNDLKLFFEYAQQFNIINHIELDFSLARGLDYYTGPIFEFIMVPHIQSQEIGVGSVAGGGRYDNLIGMLNKKSKQIPAVGISIGVERLMSILENQSLNQKIKTRKTQILVTSLSPEYIHHRLSIAKDLWDAGIPTEILYKNKSKALRDFQHCEEHSIPFCIIIGQNEIEGNFVTLRNIQTRTQISIPRDSLVQQITQILQSL